MNYKKPYDINMKENDDYVSPELAIQLRKCGFDGEGIGATCGIYCIDEADTYYPFCLPKYTLVYDDILNSEIDDSLREYVALRPNYSIVTRWLRSKNIHIDISLSDYDEDESPKYNATAYYISPERTEFLRSDDDSCNSYEETFENICLKVLEVIQK